MKRVLVFGTFDGLHPGHDYFLREAKRLGDRLTVSLARNSTVVELKGREPKRDEGLRRQALAESEYVDEIIYGDRTLGAYQIIDDIKPDIIALGYDQLALRADLERFIKERALNIELISIAAFEPQRFHSLIL
jgi:FAD synthetase